MDATEHFEVSNQHLNASLMCTAMIFVNFYKLENLYWLRNKFWTKMLNTCHSGQNDSVVVCFVIKHFDAISAMALK